MEDDKNICWIEDTREYLEAVQVGMGIIHERICFFSRLIKETRYMYSLIPNEILRMLLQHMSQEEIMEICKSISAEQRTRKPETKNIEEVTQNENSKRYVYGLRGIRELFNVSHVTAQQYKNTFLAPAIMQRGRKIIVDADKAMQLFYQERFINHP